MPVSKSAKAVDEVVADSLEKVTQAIGPLTFGSAETPLPRTKNQPRYRHILVAYDGSEGSRHALEWAKDLAKSFGSEVTVATAFNSPQISVPAGMGYAWYPDYSDAYDAIEQRTREAAQSAATLLVDFGINASSRAVEGSPGTVLARVASEEHADLVIVGATRGGRVKRLLLGSTAESLLARAECNVLIARGPPQPPRILVATDGSHAGYRAVAYALHRAGQTGADLIVQHVLDYPGEAMDDVPPEGFVKAVAERLELPSAPPKVRYVVDVGHPANHILIRAGQEDVGLIVVGSQGKGALERMFVGSTSRRVANESHASVLVVKNPEGESS